MFCFQSITNLNRSVHQLKFAWNLIRFRLSRESLFMSLQVSKLRKQEFHHVTKWSSWHFHRASSSEFRVCRCRPRMKFYVRLFFNFSSNYSNFLMSEFSYLITEHGKVKRRWRRLNCELWLQMSHVTTCNPSCAVRDSLLLNTFKWAN